MTESGVMSRDCLILKSWRGAIERDPRSLPAVQRQTISGTVFRHHAGHTIAKANPGYCAGFLPILLVVLTASCRREAGPAYPNPVQPAVETRIHATVTDDALRVRSSPYLDAEVVGRLMRDDRVIVESRTVWKQKVGDRDSAWYFVRAEGFSGWAYGAYLQIPPDVRVPTDPAMSPPAPLSAEPQAIDSGPAPIDTAQLPELLLPDFGLNEPVLIDFTDAGSITWNEIHEMLVLPFTDREESALAGFAGGGADDKLIIAVESLTQAGYRRRYGPDELAVQRGGDGSPSAVLIPFHPLATNRTDNWEVYAFLNDEEWPTAVGRVKVTPAEVSVVPSRNPDPLRDSPRSRYSRGDTAWISGRISGSRGQIGLAFYAETGETREGRVLLRPVLALSMPTVGGTDSWTHALTIDERLPDGRCWMVLADPELGFGKAGVFFTSIEVVRQ